jgi:hypothetical protein
VATLDILRYLQESWFFSERYAWEALSHETNFYLSGFSCLTLYVFSYYYLGDDLGEGIIII